MTMIDVYTWKSNEGTENMKAKHAVVARTKEVRYKGLESVALVTVGVMVEGQDIFHKFLEQPEGKDEGIDGDELQHLDNQVYFWVDSVEEFESLKVGDSLADESERIVELVPDTETTHMIPYNMMSGMGCPKCMKRSVPEGQIGYTQYEGDWISRVMKCGTTDCDGVYAVKYVAENSYLLNEEQIAECRDDD